MTILPVLLTLLHLPVHQQRFFIRLMPLWQAVPGRINALNLSRYSGWNERTFRRWFSKALPWDTLHWGLLELLVQLGALDSGFVLCMDASFIPKSGIRTDGVGEFWNGSQSRSEQGLELSCLAVMSWAGRHVFPVSVVQTQPRQDKADRLIQYRDQLQALLAQRRSWFARHLKAVVADGQYAKVMFMDAICGEGYAFVTKLQSNADLLYPYAGENPKRRGGKRKWAGKVDFVNFAGWIAVPGKTDERVWTRVVWGPHFKRFFRIVVIENLDGRGRVKSHVVLCSTDTTMPAERIRALYSARFQLEFVFRDAKQFAGLTTCQLRKTQALGNHWNAAFFALSLGRADMLLEASGLQGRPVTSLVFSYEDIKRRAFNRLFAWRILSNLGLQARFAELEKHPSRPLNLGVKAA
ncbi:transposase [Deinococcus arenicola]|uniref:Transposase n=1 Tax=Deinococcus arenicola TaxID=2994950 RepID=A0ABU4DQQ1_9DEIO|nr:transposase [Deinococcus sp. ZS9-10]MDV6374754.1 transposase [Deinococcus sp. ZS9-10]